MEFALRVASIASIITILILAANHFGEYASGLLSGLPFTTAPALLLIAVERGSGAAADAAVGGIVGCALASMFALAYHGAARRLSPAPALAFSVACMAASLAVVSRLSLSLALAGVATCVCSAVALWLIRNPAVAERAPEPRTLSRGAWAAFAIGLSSAAVTTIVIAMSPVLAGIVAAMPIIGVAAAASCHATRGRAAVPRYLRGYVISSLAKAVFCAAFASCVVSHGIAVALLAGCFFGGLVCAVALAAKARSGASSCRPFNRLGPECDSVRAAAAPGPVEAHAANMAA